MKGLNRAVRRSTDLELVNALSNCRRELNKLFEVGCFEDNPLVDDYSEIEMAVMVEMSRRFSERCLELAR